jgi:hypothetical protein
MSDIHQFSHAADIQLAHHILAMFAHGERADAQSPGDFLARQTVADKPNDLDFSRPYVGNWARKGADRPSERWDARRVAIACAVSCAVVRKPSFLRMLARCLRTVNSDIVRALAMCLQLIACPMSNNTSPSLLVRRATMEDRNSPFLLFIVVSY